MWERKCFRVDFNAINIHIVRAIMIFLPLTPIRALASLGPRIGILFVGRNIIMPAKVNINPLLKNNSHKQEYEVIIDEEEHYTHQHTSDIDKTNAPHNIRRLNDKINELKLFIHMHQLTSSH